MMGLAENKKTPAFAPGLEVRQYDRKTLAEEDGLDVHLGMTCYETRIPLFRITL
jgi:hypothetical protein